MPTQWWQFFNWGVFESREWPCKVAHSKSVAVLWLCILYKIWCKPNPLHPLYGALPVPVQVTCGTVNLRRLWSHIGSLMRILTAEHRSIARLLFAFQHFCETVLVTQYSMASWRGIGGFQEHLEQGQCLFIGLAARSLFVSSCFSFLFFHSMEYGLGLWGWGLRTDRVLIVLSQACTLHYQPFFNNNNHNNNLSKSTSRSFTPAWNLAACR